MRNLFKLLPFYKHYRRKIYNMYEGALEKLVSNEIKKIPKFSNEKNLEFKKRRSYNLTNKSKIRNYQLTTNNKNWGLFSSLSISDYGDIIMGKNRKHGYDNWGLVNQFSENNRENYFEDHW